jgi:hypothetical protein
VFKQHRACASEFDYGAWRSWGEWRRAEAEKKELEKKSGCEYGCDFPSECRWGREAVAEQQKKKTTQKDEKAQGKEGSEPTSSPRSCQASGSPLSTIASLSPEGKTFDEILDPSVIEATDDPAPKKDDFWSTFIASTVKKVKN